jgi:hypothetical protein
MDHVNDRDVCQTLGEEKCAGGGGTGPGKGVILHYKRDTARGGTAGNWQGTDVASGRSKL